MSFENLLAELKSLEDEQNTMLKALPADDGTDEAKIQAAAEEGGELDEQELDEDEDEAEELEGAPLGKVTLEDGTEVEAVDGTEMVKALSARVQALEKGQGGQMLKALNDCFGLIRTQKDLIKSLQNQVQTLGGERRGRKSILSVIERPDAGSQMAKSEPNGMTGQEFMAKSHAAFDAGKINGVELTTIDVSLRSGVPIAPGVIQKVLS